MYIAGLPSTQTSSLGFQVQGFGTLGFMQAVTADDPGEMHAKIHKDLGLRFGA